MKRLSRIQKQFFDNFRIAEQNLNGVHGKAVLGVLFQKEEYYQELQHHLETVGVEIEFESESLRFDSTDYYEKEMGTELRRIFLSLKGIFPVEESVLFKLETTEWEHRWRESGLRSLNLDPGYLDLHKLVLLSAKEGPQKIYLGQGVWADLCLLRRSGHFDTLPWTFPDLRDRRYHSFFEKVRDAFKQDLKAARKS